MVKRPNVLCRQWGALRSLVRENYTPIFRVMVSELERKYAVHHSNLDTTSLNYIHRHFPRFPARERLGELRYRLSGEATS